MNNTKMPDKPSAEKTYVSGHNQMQGGSENSSHGNGGTNILKQYRMVLLLVAANLVLWYFSPFYARMSLSATGSIFKEMLLILPPMFLFVGMLDQWVPKQIIHKHVGSESGVKGLLIAMLLGSMTIGPLYAGFPLAAMLLKKGAKVSNVVAFLTVKAAAEVPLLLVESKFMGLKFALIRLGLTFTSAIIMGLIVDKASRRWSAAADLPWQTEGN